MTADESPEPHPDAPLTEDDAELWDRYQRALEARRSATLLRSFSSKDEYLRYVASQC